MLRSDQQAISEYYARTDETHLHPESAGAVSTAPRRARPFCMEPLAYLECRLHSTQPAGDHTIFIAEVEEVMVWEGDPLLYFRSQYRDIAEVRG